MAYKVFIDGKEGTTGLKIYERFATRTDIEIMQISEDKRKDIDERRKFINESDFTFLCLPDAAAIESADLCTNPHTRVLDASTAHRTTPGWAYGFPELAPSFRKDITSSNRVAVPGCYASGFNSICYPLTAAGVLPRDYPVVCHAVSGYSGAGKKAIAQYEDPARAVASTNAASAASAPIDPLKSPRLYALTQAHKHLPEMQKISGLDFIPVFDPYVCDYFSGMSVTVPFHTRLLSKKVTAHDVWEIFAQHYEGCRFVKVAGFMGEGTLAEPFIPANTLSGTNEMHIFVCGNDDRIMITSQFDNLGKGASGAAVQCMNIMMGIDEGTGL